jgi:signal transduction histidine kinase
MTDWVRDAPIRHKLIAITMITVAASLALAAAVFFVWDYRTFRQYVAEDIGSTAGVVADNIKAAVAFKDPVAADETLASLRAKPHVASACVFDLDGTVLAAFSRSNSSPACPDEVRADGDYHDRRGLLVFRPVRIDGTRVGTLFLRRTFQDLDRHFELQSALLIAVLAVALSAALLLSNRLQRIVSAPIIALARTARQVTMGRDYSLRATAVGGDEVGMLVGAFNAMLAQIEERTAELQRAQTALERSVAELQETSRLKDEFLATVSHELRTPLNAVLGWARMLRVEPGFDREKRQRALDSIERNALAQARIVDDLLDMSRIIAGKLRLDLKPVHLATVISAAAEIVRPAADARQVTLITDCSQAGDDLVLGDADRLQQMIWNILSNGVKFTPAGGHLRVELRRNDQMQLELTARDTGRGIDPEFLPHAFDLFRQADSSSTREHGGLGLGLAITRRIVELHGGTIHLDSAGPDRGTTVTVRLPEFSGRHAAAG